MTLMEREEMEIDKLPYFQMLLLGVLCKTVKNSTGIFAF